MGKRRKIAPLADMGMIGFPFNSSAFIQKLGPD